MTSEIKNYLELEQKLKQITHLSNIAAITHWDAATMLSNGSTKNRHQELATLSSMIHSITIGKEMNDLISGSIQEFDKLDDWQKANLANIKKSYDKQICISSDLLHRHSLSSSKCEFVWRTARKENDFNRLAPYLDKVFDLVREISILQAGTLKKSPLDTLIDTYDPDRTSHEIKSVFSSLKTHLPALINQIIDKQKNQQIIYLSEKIDENTQKQINLKIMNQMGFNFDCGRLDKSVHPFCTGSNDDVRITIRYDESNFLSSLYGVIHETGHALYQQNLPADYRNQPVGGPKGMSFHESQSLIMEKQVGMSRPFTEYLAKTLKDDFSLSGPEYSADNLYKLVTKIEPSFIRVDADEATYPLHVILRFEIEEAIIDDNLKAADLPELWNSKMQAYFGITPINNAQGCMQDLHWPSGALGYFPSYTNGAIIASMLMAKVKEKEPNINAALSQGDFTTINKYLRNNLRKYGSSKNSADLLTASTGYDTIQPSIFLDYLKGKYL